MEMCKLFDIPFNNQSLQSVVGSVFHKYNEKGGKKFSRAIFTPEFRNQIAKDQHFKCNTCQTSIKSYFEIDHILPLSVGGDNSRENLQALCKEHHKQKTLMESAERLFACDNTISSYNKQLRDVFRMSKNGFVHNFLNREVVKHLEEKGKMILFGLDINKCRKNIVTYSKYNYCVFSVLDNVKPFDIDNEETKKIPTGYYYVESDRLFPLKGNGWYSNPMIKYCLKKGIITREQIKYVIIPSITLPADYYNKFINHVYEKEGLQETDKKIAINSFIGALGSKMHKEVTSNLTSSLNEASYCYFKNNGCFIANHGTENGEEKFYEMIKAKEAWMDDNHVPIFNQILDMEAIELYEISLKLKKMGGQILYANTDNVVAGFDPKLTSYEKLEKCSYLKEVWSESNLKYKIANSLSNHDREEKACTVAFTYNSPCFDEIEDDGSNQFKPKAKAMIELNSSFQIAGRGGCGKSHMIKTIIDEFKSKNIKYRVLAPTHKALRVISTNEGSTIHRFVNMFNSLGYDMLKGIEYIIVDEMSMIKEMFFNIFSKIKRNTDIKFIFAGDFKQLAPVCDRKENFNYEDAHLMHELCDGTKMLLSKCRRSDTELFDICTNVLKVKQGDFGKKECNRSICFTNATRKSKNQYWMEKTIKDGNLDHTLIESDAKLPLTQDIYAYVGLPLVCCYTSKKYDIANSETFTIKKVTHSAIVIESDEGELVKTIPFTDVCSLFYPAYCMTTHKSQGSSFKFEYTIYEWSRMNENMKYVALSRGITKSKVNIIW